MMQGMAQILNLVRREIDRVLNGMPHPQWGIVTSYNENTYSVKVRLQPDDIETEWMPLPVEHVGNGYGLLMAPEIDDLVLVGYTDGSRDAPYIIARAHNDEQKPPKVEAGEMVLMHKSKGYIKIDKDNVLVVKHGNDKEHAFVMRDDTMEMTHADGESAIIFQGEGKVLIKGRKIMLDASEKLVLGGTDGTQALIMNGDPDTAGNANMATQSKVYMGAGAGSIPAAPPTPTPSEFVGV